MPIPQKKSVKHLACGNLEYSQSQQEIIGNGCGRDRTYDRPLRRRMLYPLSYAPKGFWKDKFIVAYFFEVVEVDANFFRLSDLRRGDRGFKLYQKFPASFGHSSPNYEIV